MLDISLPMKPDMLLYPGDRPPLLRRLSSLELGEPLTASELSIGCHVGTHVDAPAHFCIGGATLENLGIRHFVGPAIVLDVLGTNKIDESHLVSSGIPLKHHILIKTENSFYLRYPQFKPDCCYLMPGAARYLVSHEPLSIGFDYYSLDPPSTIAFPAHTIIAEHGLPVFVCLDLSAVSAGRYEFFGVPIPIQGAEGMPVRALLREALAK